MTATVRAEDWWVSLSASALIGTARREPPTPPPGFGDRPDATPETRLLDAAAVAGALHRAGRIPAHLEPPAPAPDDAAPPAPDRAAQLLQLLLTQPPVRAELRPFLLGHWHQACAAAGRRVPEPMLPAMLDAAGRDDTVRAQVRAVIGERGRWLARHNPDWSWAAAAAPPPDAVEPPDDWALLPTGDRADWVVRLRRTDPDRARELVESTWASDGATDRTTLLGLLEAGLGPADEDLLERALDDRAASVRATAQALLERLPTSRRAQRLADRLAPLLSVHGVLRRTLRVALPDDPDQAAVRDGLGKAPAGRSRRAHHLELLAAGAPFEVWTDASGRGPAETARMIEDADALLGLARAARVRRDPVWADALLPVTGDPALLPLLEPPRREEYAAGLLDRAGQVPDVVRVLVHVPGPWGEPLSRVVVGRLRRHRQPVHVAGLTPVLAERLHPAVVPEVRAWAQSDHTWSHLPDDLVQYLSLVPAIAEAFR